MKTFISIGDFIDIYYKFILHGTRFFINRMAIKNITRTKKAWQQNTISSAHWWSIPKVKERWNKIITGKTKTEYPEYVVNKYLKDRKYLKLISPGCGSGSKEVKFAQFKQFSSLEGFDLSPNRVEHAKENAQQLGINNLYYFVDDVNKHNFGEDHYDLVLFDSSLHHFKNLDLLLEKMYKAIKPDGLLIINEYVGPDRLQWSKIQLNIANYCLTLIPTQYRTRLNSKNIKSKIYRPGYLRMIIADPSEAVNSSNILPQIKKRFSTIEEKPYGGNLLHLLFKDIAHNFINSSNEIDTILNSLFEIEDDFIKENVQSDFVFGIYGK